jgi:hypothetical protein
MNFACPRFVTIRGVGDLDVPYLSKVLTQGGDEIPLHALHMVHIILVLEIRTVDLGK